MDYMDYKRLWRTQNVCFADQLTVMVNNGIHRLQTGANSMGKIPSTANQQDF